LNSGLGVDFSVLAKTIVMILKAKSFYALQQTIMSHFGFF